MVEAEGNKRDQYIEEQGNTWSGGGFGFSGAVKGAIQASALNAAQGKFAAIKSKGSFKKTINSAKKAMDDLMSEVVSHYIEDKDCEEVKCVDSNDEEKRESIFTNLENASEVKPIMECASLSYEDVCNEIISSFTIIQY